MNRINGMMGEHVLCEDGFEVIKSEETINLPDYAQMEDDYLDAVIEALEKHIKEKEGG